MLGHDPQSPGREFRQRIGVVLQQSELWPNLTVRETHKIFAGYYEQPRDVDEVIDLVGLTEKRDARVKTLSGGQKRRLDLGVALVGDPDLVFLDEPTTGFDPAARRAAWEMIRSLRSLGKTVLLTTHYLDEAEQLADRVAVMREGRIVKIGTPRELTTAELEVEIRYRRAGEEVVVRTSEPTRVLNELTSEALARGEELERLEVRRPTLEEVYLSLARRRAKPNEDLRARAPRAAARVLAEQGGRALHLPLPAASLRPARLRVQREDLRRARAAGAARGPDRLRLRKHRVRGSRDPARRAPRARDPQAAARDAAARDDVHRRDAHVDADRLRRSRRSRSS